MPSCLGCRHSCTQHFPPVKHVVILDPIFWCYCCLLWSWVTWLDLSIPSHTHALMDSSFFFLECTSGLFCWKENVDNIWGYWSEKIVIYNRLNLVWYFMFDWMMHCWKFLLKLNISQTSYSFALKLSFILFFFSIDFLWSSYDHCIEQDGMGWYQRVFFEGWNCGCSS